MAKYTDCMAANRYTMGTKFRGKLIVINNEEFLDTRYNKRNGTERDVQRLKSTFGQLGFEVEPFKNKTTAEMLQIMLRVATCGLGGYDCLAVAILTHGEDKGLLAGTGAPVHKLPDLILPDLISLDELFKPLKRLADGKPKLIFIQACRGDTLDEGKQLLQSDSASVGKKLKGLKVPMEADFLYHFASAPGYYSFRNTNGSIFIQALCDVLDQHIQQNVEIDLMKCLTRVNRKVAEEYESRATMPGFSGKNQMPSIVSMLRKDVFLHKKK